MTDFDWARSHFFPDIDLTPQEVELCRERWIRRKSSGTRSKRRICDAMDVVMKARHDAADARQSIREEAYHEQINNAVRGLVDCSIARKQNAIEYERNKGVIDTVRRVRFRKQKELALVVDGDSENREEDDEEEEEEEEEDEDDVEDEEVPPRRHKRPRTK